MSISFSSVSVEIPRRVREILAADADLAAYFEQITLADLYQLEGPIRTPSLYVVPGVLTQERQVGGETEGSYIIQVVAVLPVPTPFRYDLAATGAPTSSLSAIGPLTGTYGYAVTQFNADGESAASPVLSVAPAAQWVTITKPTLSGGALGWRIWRTEANRTALRHAVTLRPDAATWKDVLPDGALGDELAPVPFYAEALLDHAAKVLYANERLTDSTPTSYASAALAVQQGEDQISTARNLRVRALAVTVQTYFDAATSQIIGGSV